VRAAVDDETTRSADAFAAVAVERHRRLAARHQPLVQDIEGLEQRRLWTHLVEDVADEAAGILRTALAPDAKRDLHRYDHSLEAWSRT
jgi:hypothetical protein